MFAALPHTTSGERGERMRKVAARLVTLFVAAAVAAAMLPALAVSAAPPLDFTPKTETLLLVDMSTGEAVYSAEADKVRPMASLTKIMTYIVTAEHVDDLAGTQVEILDEPLNDIRGRGASLAGVEAYVGKTLSVLDLLYGLMLPSGCDAAAELAWYVCGGDLDAFVKLMNDKAAELGCKNTTFVDSHGLSDGNTTTAWDMYRIASYALGVQHFREVVTATKYTLPGAAAPMYTSVMLQDRANGGRYYYPYASGIKTGYISAAGRCLVSTATKGGTSYMCIALGSEYDPAQNNAMLDSVALYKWAFKNFTENVDVDIRRRFVSMQLGSSEPLEFSVGGEGETLSWSSSDPSVAEVDSRGVVTAHSLGEAVIRAESRTGNVDECTVSAGYYNGIYVSEDYGDYTSGARAQTDWAAVKDAGLDFAIIRAETGSGKRDADFEANVSGAEANGVPYGLYLVSGAKTTEEAAADARRFAEELKAAGHVPALPVFYDLTGAGETGTALALAFSSALAQYGLEGAVYAPRESFAAFDLAALGTAGVPLWCRYIANVNGFDGTMKLPGGVTPDVWQHRTNLYFPEAAQNRRGSASANLIYMLSARAADMTPPETAAVQTDGEAEVVLSWRAPGYDFDGYAVYRRDGGEPELIATLGGTASVYTDTSVEYGHTYVYTVAARVGGDIFDEDYRAEVGGDSREVAVTPPELPSAPPEDAPPAAQDGTSEEPKQDTEAESKPEAGIYVAAVFGAAALVAAVGSVKGGKNQKGKRSK